MSPRGLATSLLLLLLLAQPAGSASPALSAVTVLVDGLSAPVEILRDRWGVAHIYAQSEHDLFFAQGYNAARDRLFQLELWRRGATGTMAEILGPRALSRHNGLLANVQREVELAQAVRILGVERVKDLAHFQGGDPDLTAWPRSTCPSSRPTSWSSTARSGSR